MPPVFMEHWHNFTNIMVSDKGFAFLLGLIVGYIIRAIKV